LNREVSIHSFNVVILKFSTRIFGTATCAIAFVAAGGVDAFCHLGLHCWDLAAGQLIAEEAGGFLCDYGG